MMRRNSTAGIVGGILLLLVLGAGPVASRAAETKAVPPVQPATQPVPAVPPDYRYSPAGKPDPFKPFLEMDQALPGQKQQGQKQEGQKKRSAAKRRPISPLQQAEIAQFRLVGIAGDEKMRTAIVEERSTKKFYPLSVGTYIGPNEGRVAEILADRVVVVERVETQNNKRKKMQMRRIPMLLHQEP